MPALYLGNAATRHPVTSIAWNESDHCRLSIGSIVTECTIRLRGRSSPPMPEPAALIYRASQRKKENPNLATTFRKVARDAAKLITGVPLDYPDPLLTPLATVPQPAKEEPIMDDEKEKPIVDQMTDVVADAAGELAKTAVKAVAKRAKKAVAVHTPRPVKKAAKAVAKAAKAPKKTSKKTVKKAKKAVAKKAKKAVSKKSKKAKKSKAKKSKR